MTSRRHLSGKERLRLFQLHKGICHLCAGKVQVGQAWDISHDIPLELGGADDDGNSKPAHRKCHRDHTAAVDQPNIARAKRRERKHVGIRKRSSFPCGRDSAFKKRMDGSVVRR